MNLEDSAKPIAAVLVVMLAGAVLSAEVGEGDLAWRGGRVPVVRDPVDVALQHRSVSDNFGGVIVAWQRGTAGGIRVQRLDEVGIQRWLPATGVVLSGSGSNPALSANETGGAVVAWEEPTGIRVQHVGLGGRAQWKAGGVRVSSSGSRPEVHADPSGGAWIAWRDDTTRTARVAYVDRRGVVSDPGLDGISLGAGVRSPGDMRLVADGLGGVIAVWADDDEGGRIRAQQLPVSPIWGATPKIVSADPSRGMSLVDAIPDGAGGVLLAWVASDVDQQLRLQRLSDNGEASWTVDGVVLVVSDVVAAARVASDGSGGAIVAWTDHKDVYLQRVDSSGALAWNHRGIQVSDDPAGSATSPEIAADNVGGVIVTYEQSVVGPKSGEVDTEIAAARFDERGNRRWSRRLYVDSGSDPSYDQLAPLIVFSDPRPLDLSAIVTWYDAEVGDLYAAKVRILTPSNDACAEAIEIPPGTHAGTLESGTLDGSSSCGGEVSDVWYRIVSPGDGTLLVDTCGTNDIGGTDGGVDTVLSLHATCPDAGGSYELACNDDWPGSADPLACSGIDLGGFFGDSYVEKAVVINENVLIRVSRYPDEVDGPFSLRVRFVPAPGANDDCRNATVISEGSFVGTLVGATTDGEASCSDPPGPDLWYSFTAAGNGSLILDTCGSNDMPGEDLGVDTVISVHSSCPTGPNSNEIPGACNDDWYFGNNPTACDGIDLGADVDSALTLDVVAAQEYLIRVSRYPGTIDADFSLNVASRLDPAGYVPDGGTVPGNPLRLTRLADNSVRLEWDPSCMVSDDDFVVYEGVLGSYSSHQPVVCTTAGVTQWDAPAQPGNQFFLVVPHNGTREGSHGFLRDATGSLVERPAASLYCFPRTVGSCL